MNANYESEPAHAGESRIGHELQDFCGFLVSLVCDIDPHSEMAHMIHELEELEAAKEQPK